MIFPVRELASIIIKLLYAFYKEIRIDCRVKLLLRRQTKSLSQLQRRFNQQQARPQVSVSHRHSQSTIFRVKTQVKRGRPPKRANEMNHENSSSSPDKSDQNNSSNNEKNLTKKKIQYLEQAIIDRAGVIKFEDNPEQYKKARKRL